MSTTEFLILYVSVLATMLLSRCLPLFVLKGRSLSPKLTEALELIPPAAFAALVANDLFQPTTLAQNPLEGTLPFVAALPVLIVAKQTKSLIWCALVGMAAYALLLQATGLL